MIRRPPRSTQSRSSAASDVYKRQEPPHWLRNTLSCSSTSEHSHPQPLESGPCAPAAHCLPHRSPLRGVPTGSRSTGRLGACLLYTSDAADDLLCVDLGGRRI